MSNSRTRSVKPGSCTAHDFLYCSGEKFTSSVNKSRLAKTLSEIMLQAEKVMP